MLGRQQPLIQYCKILQRAFYGDKRDALNMTKEEFAQLLGEEGKFERYRPTQAYQFINYSKGKNWSDAQSLPLYIREWLDGRVLIDHGTVVKRQQSSDGTRKYLVRVGPEKVVETVLIPEEERATLCLSSQVGCSLRCTFCHTGTQKFDGNLTAGEILRQFYALGLPIRDSVTNFVFMGQGEPLYNFRNLDQAISVMTNQENGLGFGHGKITVSTSGITPLIPKVASVLGVNLAVSLHAPNDMLRDQIMPINKTYPLKLLMAACEEFISQASCATRRVSFEYVMLRQVNDQPTHAKELSTLVKHLPAHVNLIPFNPWPGASYHCTPLDGIKQFQDILEQRGIPTTVRRTRGRDIMAACGQLKSLKDSKESASSLLSSSPGLPNQIKV